MRITDKKTETHEVDVIVDRLCNQCGKSCMRSCGAEGLIDAEANGGFDSKILGDGTGYMFSLCEICLDNLFKVFKHPPAVRNHMLGPYEWSQPKSMQDLEAILRGEEII